MELMVFLVILFDGVRLNMFLFICVNLFFFVLIWIWSSEGWMMVSDCVWFILYKVVNLWLIMWVV